MHHLRYNKLLLFLIVSAMTHAMVLFVNLSNDLIIGQNAGALHIRITENILQPENTPFTKRQNQDDTQKPEEKTTNTTKRQPLTKSTNTAHQVSKNELDVADTVQTTTKLVQNNEIIDTTTQENITPAAVASAQITDNQLKTKIIAHLQHDLQAHFRYPRLARRNGWQGKVTLGMQIAASGDILDLQIKESSGYAVLDNNALNTLRKIGQLRWNRELLNGNNIQILLPVIYRLTEG